jgi:hypothetical protein
VNTPSCARASRWCSTNGGKIETGAYGELAISLPARLTNSDNVMDGMAEGHMRDALQGHIANIVAGHRVVLHALKSNAKSPSEERIPAGYPTAGGGLSGS